MEMNTLAVADGGAFSASGRNNLPPANSERQGGGQSSSGNSKLLYRRQFLLARCEIVEFSGWNLHRVGGFFLYSHPDLNIDQAHAEERSVTLIGYLFDPERIARSNSQIVQNLAAECRCFDDLVLALKRLTGRYVILFKNDNDFRLINDPLALREVYYCVQQNRVVCASQPHVVARFSSPELKPTTDASAQRFRVSEMTRAWCGLLWPGDETWFGGVKHLLPNHSLNLQTLCASRYWPTEPVKHVALETAIERCSRFLEGALQAAAERHKLMLAVTAGTDSRTLLAASRSIKDRVYYFINQERDLSRTSADISIPTKMCARVGVPFHIHCINGGVDPTFAEVFHKSAFLATDRILPTIYTYYRHHSDKMNVMGIGEIGRTRFGPEPTKLNPELLSLKLGFTDSEYAIQQCDRWLRDSGPVAKRCGINVLTLLYWEQVLGNWLPVGNTESDVAMEEFDPCASHQLYETMLGVDEKYCTYANNVLFRGIIESMWPELLEFPINPPDTLRKHVVHVLKNIGVHSWLKSSKYQLYRMCHRLRGRSESTRKAGNDLTAKVG